jgi:hypothetical protein
MIAEICATMEGGCEKPCFFLVTVLQENKIEKKGR